MNALRMPAPPAARAAPSRASIRRSSPPRTAVARIARAHPAAPSLCPAAFGAAAEIKYARFVGCAAEDTAADAPSDSWESEELFYEGTGAKSELYMSLLLGMSLLWLPLTMADVGRQLWIKYRFTNKRVSVIIDSPIRNFRTDIAYSEIKDCNTVGRVFGLWGDMVITLKDGQQVSITCIEGDDFQMLRDYVRSQAASAA